MNNRDQLANHPLGGKGHSVHFVVSIQAFVEESAQGLYGLPHRRGKGHDLLSGMPDIVRMFWPHLRQMPAGLHDQITYHAIDEPANQLMRETLRVRITGEPANLNDEAAYDGQMAQIVKGKQAGAQAVVEIVAAIGDIVRDCGDLRLQGGVGHGSRSASWGCAATGSGNPPGIGPLCLTSPSSVSAVRFRPSNAR